MGSIRSQVSSWDYWLSFLFERHIISIESEMNGVLSLYLRKGRLMLCANEAIYSYDDLYYIFREGLLLIKDFIQEDVKKVLVLGMGMGSIPILLENLVNKPMHYTLLEYDESVVWLAHKYSLHRLNNPFEVHIADAARYVQLTEEVFDLICVDVYKDHIIPHYFQSYEFLKNCKEILAPHGKLLYNAPTAHFGATTDEVNDLNTHFQKAFPFFKSINVQKNILYLSSLPTNCGL